MVSGCRERDVKSCFEKLRLFMVSGCPERDVKSCLEKLRLFMAPQKVMRDCDDRKLITPIWLARLCGIFV